MATIPTWNPDSRLTPAELKEQLGRKKPGGPSPTSQLTRAALAVLHLHGFTAWRQNNGAVYDQKRGAFRAGSAKKGVSDIIGFYEKTGHMVAVEIKTGKDSLSDEQTAFLAGIGRAGGFAFECRDNIDQLQAALREWLTRFK